MSKHRYDNNSATIRHKSNQCVRCGLCLPHCPTYQIHRQEAESPRGRIEIMTAIASGRLTPSSSAMQHLNNCLQCNNCATVCPSGVDYSGLFDLSRAHIIQRRRLLKRTFLPRWLSWLTQSRSLQRCLHAATVCMNFYQISSLISWLIGRRWATLLPESKKIISLKPSQNHAIASHRAVNLFVGCMDNALDRETVKAAIHLLTTLGYSVSLNKQQTCCGGLHCHAGDENTLRRVAKQNVNAFLAAQHADKPILTLATGCHAVLARYHDHPFHVDRLPTEQSEQYRQFCNNIVDIAVFISQAMQESTTKTMPLQARVGLFMPCSGRSLGQTHRLWSDCLMQISGLTIIPITASFNCCGASGQYMLTHPHLAEQLRAPCINAIKAANVDMLLTHNIGCQIHLRAGLRTAGMTIPVVHPIQLLAQQTLGVKNTVSSA